jgi:hypothetical protein
MEPEIPGIQPAKAEEQTPQESGKSLPWHILWLLIAGVLVAYPLSIGPVAKHHRHNLPQVLESFYAPLATLYDKSPPMHHFFDWYLENVWGVHIRVHQC